jgi:hypothetical protein
MKYRREPTYICRNSKGQLASSRLQSLDSTCLAAQQTPRLAGEKTTVTVLPQQSHPFKSLETKTQKAPAGILGKPGVPTRGVSRRSWETLISRSSEASARIGIPLKHAHGRCQAGVPHAHLEDSHCVTIRHREETNGRGLRVSTLGPDEHSSCCYRWRFKELLRYRYNPTKRRQTYTTFRFACQPGFPSTTAAALSRDTTPFCEPGAGSRAPQAFIAVGHAALRHPAISQTVGRRR